MENYKEKYEQALEKARELMNRGYDVLMPELFPELKKESKDEQMIERLKSCVYASDITPEGSEEILAWLEEQKDYIKFPNSAYTSNKDVIEFADKYSHDVWEKLMDNFKTIENYSIGCNDVSDIVLNAIINTYNWLEKQDAKKRIFNADDWYVSEIDGKIHNPKFIEKQGEKKPTDKIEPKFHKDDWVVNNTTLNLCHILKVEHGQYICDDCSFPITKENEYHIWTIADVKIGDWIVRGDTIAQILDIQKQYYVGLDINGKDFTLSKILNDDKIHLWTIQDAKDGDVLCYKDEISLYKHDIKNCTKQETTFGGFVYYCCYDNKRFITDSSYLLTEQDKTDIHPATKDQRELLFQKIEEADYKWNSKKKEFKKVKPNILGADNILPYLGNSQVQDILDDMGMLDDNGYCSHTAEEIFKAGMKYAFNLNREVASSLKLNSNKNIE